MVAQAHMDIWYAINVVVQANNMHQLPSDSVCDQCGGTSKSHASALITYTGSKYALDISNISFAPRPYKWNCGAKSECTLYGIN
eukprot:3488609-Karenia_brevis.AAC.1